MNDIEKLTINDYALYIGQDCKYIDERVWTKNQEGDLIHTLVGIDINKSKLFMKSDSGVVMEYKLGQHKLMLRPMDSITDEEAINVAKIVYGQPDSRKWKVDRKKSMINLYRKYGDISLTICLESGEIENYIKEDGHLLNHIYLNQHFVTKYFLECGFDLFGLIEKKLAFQKTFIKV